MARVHLHLPSFNAGELSPLLGARFAVEKVASGCRKLRNFIIHTHGPAFRRPGLEDMGAASSDDSKSRLADFSFSNTTGFLLEFNPDGLQVWSNGLLVPLVAPVVLPYSEQECAELQIEQVNDVCYLAHGNHPVRQLTRYADDDWRLADMAWQWPPMRDENTPDGVVGPPTVTPLSSQMIFGSQRPPDGKGAPFIVPVGDWQIRILAPDHNLSTSLKVQRKNGLGVWKDYQPLKFKNDETVAFKMPTLTAETTFRLVWDYHAIAAFFGYAYIETVSYPVATNLTLALNALSGTDRIMTASQPLFQSGHEGSYWQITHRRDTASAQIIAAVPAIVAATSDPIRVTGAWNFYTYGTWNATVFLERFIGGAWEIARSWSSKKDRNVIANGVEEEPVQMRLRVSAGTSEAATGAAAPRFLLECENSRVDGLVRITGLGPLDGSGFATTATVDVLSELYSTDATALWTEGAFSDFRGFPRAVAIHAGRLWFGGVRDEPCRLWGSAANDYDDFRRSSYDDASISVEPAAQRSNLIQWLASFEKTLIIGTKGDEWTLSSDGPALKPTDLQMQRRSGYGSAYQPALGVADALVFVQRGGTRIRQISPTSDTTVWSAVDLTILAEHLGVPGMSSFAMMSSPFVILWAVSGDGKLLGMTFEREQNVFGWHCHETDGVVESVAVLPGETADELWVSVLRANGRRIERMDPRTLARDFSDPKQLMYLDGARRFVFDVATTTIAGLDHLEGRTVGILADGAEVAPSVVVGGVVTLDDPASVVIVGLPFTSTLQPMRMDIPLADGTAQHRRWRTSRVGLFVHHSLGGEIGDGPETGVRFEKLNYREISDAMDAPPPLLTGQIETGIESRSRDGVDVVIRQSAPLPLNVGSITIKGDVYGE